MLDIAVSETPVRSRRMAYTASLRASFLPCTARASRWFFVQLNENKHDIRLLEKAGV